MYGLDGQVFENGGKGVTADADTEALTDLVDPFRPSSGFRR